MNKIWHSKISKNSSNSSCFVVIVQKVQLKKLRKKKISARKNLLKTFINVTRAITDMLYYTENPHTWWNHPELYAFTFKNDLELFYFFRKLWQTYSPQNNKIFPVYSSRNCRLLRHDLQRQKAILRKHFLAYILTTDWSIHGNKQAGWKHKNTCKQTNLTLNIY